MANVPTYNPNSAGASSISQRRNRAMTDQLEPGSTFKLVAAAAALDEGVVQMDEMIETGEGWGVFSGRTLRDTKAHGTIPFSDVIAVSSNVGTARVAGRIDPDAFYQTARAMGFRSADLRRLAGRGRWALEASVRVERDDAGIDGDWLRSVGDAVAGAGRVLRAGERRFARAALRRVRAPRRDRARDVASTAGLDPPGDELQNVAGAASRLRESRQRRRNGATCDDRPGMPVAGKTGTARKAEGGAYGSGYRGSFVGFFPADDPQVALIVVMDEPTSSIYGGAVAAPVFQRTASRWLGTFPAIAARLSPPDSTEVTDRTHAPELHAAPLPVASSVVRSRGLNVSADAGLLGRPHDRRRPRHRRNRPRRRRHARSRDDARPDRPDRTRGALLARRNGHSDAHQRLRRRHVAIARRRSARSIARRPHPVLIRSFPAEPMTTLAALLERFSQADLLRADSGVGGARVGQSRSRASHRTAAPSSPAACSSPSPERKPTATATSTKPSRREPSPSLASVPSTPTCRRSASRNSRAALAHASALMHGDPAQRLAMMGVTGTNGKTTTTYLLHQMTQALGHKAGLIGTIETRIGDEVVAATHTTPGPEQLHKLLARMANAGCTHCAMEVSSHALDQDRVTAVPFAAAAFTNLTRDHLDYHGSMDAYRAAKRRLFENLHPQVGRRRQRGRSIGCRHGRRCSRRWRNRHRLRRIRTGRRALPPGRQRADGTDADTRRAALAFRIGRRVQRVQLGRCVLGRRRHGLGAVGCAHRVGRRVVRSGPLRAVRDAGRPHDHRRLRPHARRARKRPAYR